MHSSSHVWQTAGALVFSFTYGDSMLFLKCVTDKGGSEWTKTFTFSISLCLTPPVEVRHMYGLCYNGPLGHVKYILHRSKAPRRK